MTETEILDRLEKICREILDALNIGLQKAKENK